MLNKNNIIPEVYDLAKINLFGKPKQLNIQVGADGITPVVPYDEVENMVCEYYELATTLFTEINSYNTKTINALYPTVRSSKKYIDTLILRILKATNYELKKENILKYAKKAIYEMGVDMNKVDSTQFLVSECAKQNVLPILHVVLLNLRIFTSFVWIYNFKNQKNNTKIFKEINEIFSEL